MGVVVRRLADYARLARFDRPAGALLLLWPTMWALWVAADGFPGWYWTCFFVVGVVVMRAFGCVVNDITDRRLDAAVCRTRTRPLAARRVSVREAVAVAIVLLLPAVALWLVLPPVARGWALLSLSVALIYPLSKRYVVMPQAVLGVAFGFGMPVAAAAVTGAHPSWDIWLFFVGNFFWIIAYDTIYAMSDRADDRAFGGVHSSALLFGRHDITAISVCYVAAILWLSLCGIIIGYGASYQVALIAAAAAVFRFWAMYKTRDPNACMAAFRANHWFGLFVFAGVAAAMN